MSQGMRLVAGGPKRGFDDLSADHIEIDKPGQGAMPDIFKLPPQNMTRLHGQIRMFTLQRLHARSFIHADRPFAFSGPQSGLCIDLTPFNDFPFPIAHRRPPSTTTGGGAVVIPLFEQVGSMSGRDLLNNTPGLQLVSDFSPGPLTDRATGLHRRFARDCGDLTTLLSGDPGWRS